MTAPRAVIFDLDGTLVDSWTLHRRCLRRACTATGAPAPSAAALALAQRGTDLATLAQLVGAGDAEAALAAYHEALLAELAGAPIAPMPSAPEVLEALARADITVGVCTGRSRPGALALLAAAGIDLPLLVAREDAPRPKPAADGLRLAVSRAGATTTTSVYVGDTLDDARQGHVAGVLTILVGRPATRCTAAIDELSGLPALLHLWERIG